MNELSANTTTYTGDGYLAQVRATSLARVEALVGSASTPRESVRNEVNTRSTCWRAAQVDGGDPIDLTGEEVLCSRSDDTFQRHFDGELAYLGAHGSPAERAAPAPYPLPCPALMAKRLTSARAACRAVRLSFDPGTGPGSI